MANLVDISESGDRVSLLTFDSRACLNIKFSDHTNHDEFAAAVDTLNHTQLGTNITRALRKVLEDMFQPKNGMRPNSRKTMILITDGDSHDSQFTNLGAEFQRNNITLLVVGVGNVKSLSLIKLVINHKDLFIAENFDDLNEMLTRDVANTICSGMFSVAIIQY